MGWKKIGGNLCSETFQDEDLNFGIATVATDKVAELEQALPGLDLKIPGKGRAVTRISRHWAKLIDGYSEKDRTIMDGWSEELDGRVKYYGEETTCLFCTSYGYDKYFPLKGLPTNDLGRIQIQENMVMFPFHCKVSHYYDNYRVKIPNPVFTPQISIFGEYTDISMQEMRRMLSEYGLEELDEYLKEISLSLFKKAYDYAESRGILIADTIFKYGILPPEESCGLNVLLGGQILSPDCTHYYSALTYKPEDEDMLRQPIREYREAVVAGRLRPENATLIHDLAVSYGELEKALLV